jgi:hypothetical protein
VSSQQEVEVQKKSLKTLASDAEETHIPFQVKKMPSQPTHHEETHANDRRPQREPFLKKKRSRR